MDIKVVKTKLEPIKHMFEKDDLFNFETNVRTKTTFSYKKPEPDTKEEYEINFARNQIFRHQYKLPVKALISDGGNTYVCQKTPNNDVSNDIKSASKVIEPLNIGFWEYIRYIPIDQNIPVGTVYLLNCKIPYNSPTRFFFMSNQIKRVDGKKIETDFDPYIHIGTLDIGSEVNGKFTVEHINTDIYDSYTLFTFRANVDSFSIITYDFMNTDAKYILTEVLKICDDKAKSFLLSCLNAC